jgi:exosortase/archaeosortase family protein
MGPGPPSPARLVARFSVGFAVVFIVLATAASAETAARWFREPLARLIVRAAAGILSPLSEVGFSESILWYRTSWIEVVDACDGVIPACIYLAAVLAVPCRWPARIWGCLVGVPAIFAINLARIVSLVLLGAWRPELFEKVHIYVGQALVIASSLALWLSWAERFVRPGARGRV